MESDQVAIVKEILKRKRAILVESLRGTRGSANPPPSWLQGLSVQRRRDMVRAIDTALQRVESEDFGFCQSCFIRMPWADIARAPEREICSSCGLRLAAEKKMRRGVRRKVAARR
jgi:hypothetical protein